MTEAVSCNSLDVHLVGLEAFDKGFGNVIDLRRIRRLPCGHAKALAQESGRECAQARGPRR
jgi:hypothetical protein